MKLRLFFGGLGLLLLVSFTHQERIMKFINNDHSEIHIVKEGVPSSDNQTHSNFDMNSPHIPMDMLPKDQRIAAKFKVPVFCVVLV